MQHCWKKIASFPFKIATAVFIFIWSSLACAANLVLEFVDELQQPLAHVVAALTTEKPRDYSVVPTAIVDQRNNMFVPDVLAVRVNTLVSFPNSDNVRHHVYSFSPAKRFELRLYHGQTAEPVLFDQPGQVVLGCNIHDSMLAYIYVVESDLFGVSDGQGRLLIEGIPPGDYQLELQHPKLDGPASTPKKLTFSVADAVSQRIVIVGTNSAPIKEDAENDLQKLFKRND